MEFERWDPDERAVHRESPDIRAVYAADPDAPAAARRALHRLCAAYDAESTEAALLLVTEVVTNAVEHARGDHVDLKLWLRGATLDVLVRDGGPGFIARARADDDRRTRGWGLMLLDSHALRWGSASAPPGAVWFAVAMTCTTFG